MSIMSRIAKLIRTLPTRKDDTQVANLLSIIANASATDALSETESVHPIMTFLAGGQATTAIAIAWIMYNLGADPKWQTLLRAELSALRASSSLSDLEALDSLPLLNHILKESLRLDPPVHFTARLATQPDTIDGHAIPCGTSVRVPIYALQRDASIWGPDAHLFNPDRWLDPTITKQSLFFCLFWHGPRGCIGQRFATLELKAFVSHVISRVSVSVSDNDQKPTARGPFATPHNMKLYLQTMPTL